jgi:hypothetical protein
MIVSTDILIIAGIFLLSSASAFYFGKSKLVALFFSCYPAILLFQDFPYKKNLIFVKDGIGHGINMYVLYGVFVFIVYKIISRFINADFEGNKFFHSILIGISCTVLFLTLGHFILPLDEIHNFSSRIDSLFTQGFGIFWWLLGPLLLLIVA